MSLIEWLLVYAGLGALVGFLAGLLGVGGGGILVPILTGLFIYQGNEPHIALRTALGTALACMVFSAAASMYAHHQQRNISWNFVWSMVPGIVAGSFLTTHFSLYIPALYIGIFFTLFMALIAAQLFFSWQIRPTQSVSTWIDKTGVGILIGFISALAAVGGGFLTITYLQYRQLGIKQAIGTTAAMGLPVALAGSLGYMITGKGAGIVWGLNVGFICVPALVAIASMSVLLAPVGANLSKKLSDQSLKKILAIICVLLSVKMLFSLLQ